MDCVYENQYGDIVCVLEDGYKIRFWEKGLSNDEYIRRTKEIRRLEEN